MSRPIRIAFRFKILVAVLFMVTAVVSFITFTMARMFHADKAAYVSDLASVISVNAADQAGIVLEGLRVRLVGFARAFDEPVAGPAQRAAALRTEFEDMPGFVAVRVLEGGADAATLVDAPALERGGVSPARLLAALDADRTAAGTVPGRPRVVNSTLAKSLPTITLTVAVPRPAGRPPLVVIGVIDQRRLAVLSRSSGAFEVFLVNGNGDVLSHADERFTARQTRFGWVPQLPEGSLSIVKEYQREGVEIIGGFSRVGFGDLVAGAQIPRSAAYFATRRLLRDLVLVALALLLAVSIVSLWWSGSVTRSLVRLTKAAEVIGRGEFGTRVDVRGHDEMGQLAGSFNQMASELKNREQALKQAQMALIQSEKMAAFGQLGAGIAHEVKNPLAGIQAIVQLTARSVKPEDPLFQTLATIEKESKRCRSIIDNLLKFARQEKLEPEPLEVHRVVEDTAAILRHQMSLHHVELRLSVGEALPKIQGSANQLQQVLMNLLINAEQAIVDSGKGSFVEVSTARAGNELLEIRVRDDGSSATGGVVPAPPDRRAAWAGESTFRPGFAERDGDIPETLRILPDPRASARTRPERPGRCRTRLENVAWTTSPAPGEAAGLAKLPAGVPHSSGARHRFDELL